MQSVELRHRTSSRAAAPPGLSMILQVRPSHVSTSPSFAGPSGAMSEYRPTAMQNLVLTHDTACSEVSVTGLGGVWLGTTDQRAPSQRSARML